MPAIVSERNSPSVDSVMQSAGLADKGLGAPSDCTHPALPLYREAEDAREAYEERAGILEYQAGLTREQAEAQARAWVYGAAFAGLVDA